MILIYFPIYYLNECISNYTITKNKHTNLRCWINLYVCNKLA